MKKRGLNKRDISFKKESNLGDQEFPVVEGIQELSRSLLSHPFDLVSNFMVLEESCSWQQTVGGSGWVCLFTLWNFLEVTYTTSPQTSFAKRLEM